jgi:hypothetical protein
MAVTYRETMLVNGILTNCESWYGLTQTEVDQLEDVDKLLLRQVFGVASSCPIEALYLELGCLPLSLIIKSRRINYLQYLAKRDSNEMLSKFFTTQWNHPVRNDWTEQVKLDLEEFDICAELSWIRSQSIMKFKKMVKVQARELALETLNQIKSNHSKMDNLFYVDLEIQEYLKDKNITLKQARAVFKFKTRMANFSNNFRGGKETKPCPLCDDGPDTQRHSLECKVIKQNIQIQMRYEDIFHSKVEQEVAKTIENVLKFREEFLNS